jgi:hypothetical protein
MCRYVVHTSPCGHSRRGGYHPHLRMTPNDHGLPAGCACLQGWQFPLVVLDEGSQCCEPECLVPLVKGCRHLVAVGDHHQLPPVCKSQEAAGAGLGTSLFERLMGAGVPSCMLQVAGGQGPGVGVGGGGVAGHQTGKGAEVQWWGEVAQVFWQLIGKRGTCFTSNNACTKLLPCISSVRGIPLPWWLVHVTHTLCALYCDATVSTQNTSPRDSPWSHPLPGTISHAPRPVCFPQPPLLWRGTPGWRHPSPAPGAAAALAGAGDAAGVFGHGRARGDSGGEQ